jgi:Domain of unknown function (DUF4062)
VIYPAGFSFTAENMHSIMTYMDKRYQVFVSSTYADLKEERRAVIQTVIELNCIPAGMELFPASSEKQLSFIKRVIDDCDYYLLIIAGRYGSVGEDGISYTEKEFDYAVSRGLPVIALVHEDPDEIAHGKSEKDPALSEKLRQFREKVCAGRLVKMWMHAHELPGFVAQSLSSTMHQSPAVGWVRANKVASEEVLADINALRKRNMALQTTVEELQVALANVEPAPALENLAGLDEAIEVYGDYHDSYYKSQRVWKAKATWREIFGAISPYLVKFPNDDVVKRVLKEALFSMSRENGYNTDLDDQMFRTIALQLQALGLVKIDYSKSLQGGMALFWSLTGAGKRLMLEIRSVRTTVAKG